MFPAKVVLPMDTVFVVKSFPVKDSVFSAEQCFSASSQGSALVTADRIPVIATFRAKECL